MPTFFRKVSPAIWLIAALGAALGVTVWVGERVWRGGETRTEVEVRVLKCDPRGKIISDHVLRPAIGMPHGRRGFYAYFDVDEHGNSFSSMPELLRRRYGEVAQAALNGVWERSGIVLGTQEWKGVSNALYVATLRNGRVQVARFSPRGELAWTHELAPPSPMLSLGGIAVDGKGNALVAGGLGGQAVEGGKDGRRRSTVPRLYAAKVSPIGGLVWEWTPSEPPIWEVAHGVDADTAGNVYLCTCTYDDSVLLKLDTSGTLVWSRRLMTTQDRQPLAVRVCPGGALFVLTRATISRENVLFHRYHLVKADADGQLLWNRPVHEMEVRDMAEEWKICPVDDAALHVMFRNEDQVTVGRIESDGGLSRTNLFLVLTNVPPRSWQEIAGIGFDALGNSYVHVANVRKIPVTDH